MSEIIVSKHAMERLVQRRGVKHMERHINKINSWGLARDGITVHKGWQYITRGGVLVTVLPPKDSYWKAKKLEVQE